MDLLEIRLSSPNDFLKVKETLTRIGIASAHSNTLVQSCHILHKRGKYYIVHFKEMFLLDNKQNSTLSQLDIQRRNTIAKLLHDWGLVSLIDNRTVEDRLPVSCVKIVPHRDKSKWNLVSKYEIGKYHSN